MKVLNVLRKAGLIAVEEDASKESREAKDDPRGRGEPKVGSTREVKNVHVVPPPPSEEALAPLASQELLVDFDKIFAALKLPVPAHGWTVEKATAALESSHFQSLDPPTKKAALLAMLGASGAPPEDVIEDAIRRDQALDSYEAFARKKLTERLVGVDRGVAEEEARIQESQKKITELKASRGKEETVFQEWLKKKVVKEEALARVVSLLTADSVISVGGVDAAIPKGDAGATGERKSGKS